MIDVRYNLVHPCVVEYSRVCKQLFNVPRIVTIKQRSVLIDRILQHSALLGLKQAGRIKQVPEIIKIDRRGRCEWEVGVHTLELAVVVGGHGG